MSVRTKLLLALLPLVIALLGLGAIGIAVVDRLGTTADRILHENYRSVLAAQRMKESLERLDSAALDRVAGADQAAGALVARHRESFEAELEAQRANLTEPDEDQLTERLSAAWRDYDRAYTTTATTLDRASYFAELEPRFRSVKAAADDLLALNQTAMSRKSDTAQATARSARTWLLAASVLALGLGVIATSLVGARILAPLRRLEAAAQRVGAGELTTRVVAHGHDELARVGHAFDDMAARLQRSTELVMAQLLLSRTAAQAAIDGLPDPVVVFGVAGELHASNRAARRELGVAPGAADPLAAVAAPLRAALERVRARIGRRDDATTPPDADAAVAIDGPGGERWWVPRASLVVGDDGDVDGASVVLQDVTRLRRFHELRDGTIATVAHEFRTPLTSLRMTILLCLEEAADGLAAPLRELLSAARVDCERLQATVDDLLDLARMQAGSLQLERSPQAPAMLVEHARTRAAHDAATRGVDLVTEIAAELPAVDVDELRIGLVFDNLVGNAVRHAPHGTTITLAARSHLDTVRFEVRDHGDGVAPEHRERLFDRFFRVPGEQRTGAGLGLSIAREVVEAHGGRIGYEPTPGGGATLWFTLARVAPHPA